MKIKSLKGTQDILPAQIPIWRYTEETSRRIFDLYGYSEVRTPIIEDKGLFVRGIGKETDIVGKQMYCFKDHGGRDICLRPEETASVVRAYLENQLDKTKGFVKFFYIGPMFRCEKPQGGRLRQFHQAGVEVIGSCSPYADAEIIILLDELLKGYGLSGYTFKINSLGCKIDKDKIKEVLKKGLKSSLSRMCGDCQRRYKTNILRVLDCKNAACNKVIKSVSLENMLCDDCAENFTSLKSILDESGPSYEVSPLLVRGLDYYTNTVFEVTSKELGAQDAIAAGGRYNNLVSDFGGEKTGACGFAIGVERVIEALSKRPLPENLDRAKELIYIATIGEVAYREGFKLLGVLRKNSLMADIDYQQKSLKAQMRYASKIGARYAVIIGEDELKEKMATIRDMQDSSQEKVGLDKVVETLKT